VRGDALSDRARRRLADVVIAGLVTAAVTACAAPEPPPVATHVDDWRDEIIYQVIVDRFADGDPDRDGALGAEASGDLARWQGGDWRGLRQRLDALAALGVTTLWISPITAGIERGADQDGYHGYWPRDFTTLEPHFGDEAELRALVDDAHARGLKVIVDVVLNHTGPVFAYDLDGDGRIDDDEHEPPFAALAPYDASLMWHVPRPRLWRDDGTGGVTTRELADLDFHRRGRTSNFGVPVERELGDFPSGLRDLTTESPALVADLVTTWREWVVRLDLDGMRLDAVPHVAPAAWRAFADGMRAELAAHGKHRFLLLGEVWNGDPAVLAGYTADGGLDAVFDFSFKWGLIDAFLLDGRAAATVVPVLTSHRDAYPRTGHPGGVGLDPWQARVAFADNHDTGRLRGELDDPWVAELAMTAVFTVDAIPCVYYGTEAELRGGRGHASREPLWQAATGDTRMARHLARLAALRRRHPALRRGELTVRFASPTSARARGPGVGLLVWERTHGDDRVLVALGGHPLDRAAATVSTGFAPGTVLRDALGIAADATVGSGGEVAIDVGPREAAVYAPR